MIIIATLLSLLILFDQIATGNHTTELATRKVLQCAYILLYEETWINNCSIIFYFGRQPIQLKYAES